MRLSIGINKKIEQLTDQFSKLGLPIIWSIEKIKDHIDLIINNLPLIPDAIALRVISILDNITIEPEKIAEIEDSLLDFFKKRPEFVKRYYNAFPKFIRRNPKLALEYLSIISSLPDEVLINLIETFKWVDYFKKDSSWSNDNMNEQWIEWITELKNNKSVILSYFILIWILWFEWWIEILKDFEIEKTAFKDDFEIVESYFVLIWTLLGWTTSEENRSEWIELLERFDIMNSTLKNNKEIIIEYINAIKDIWTKWWLKLLWELDEDNFIQQDNDIYELYINTWIKLSIHQE